MTTEVLNDFSLLIVQMLGIYEHGFKKHELIFMMHFALKYAYMHFKLIADEHELSIVKS